MKPTPEQQQKAPSLESMAQARRMLEIVRGSLLVTTDFEKAVIIVARKFDDDATALAEAGGAQGDLVSREAAVSLIRNWGTESDEPKDSDVMLDCVAAAVNAMPAAAPTGECVWTIDSEWVETACGHSILKSDEFDSEDHGLIYCGYCGLKLVEQQAKAE